MIEKIGCLANKNWKPLEINISSLKNGEKKKIKQP